ncbi:DUF1775 domain-containing protein [Streptomyces cavernae]|uniref:DUF1775 domain-containing protein n=1 Tax=Streptomyces cavernae TaxID=2259034 RepID=UPI001EE3A890|nr:DUF1775 domain-containing protein [Streptomyces cavernae]
MTPATPPRRRTTRTTRLGLVAAATVTFSFALTTAAFAHVEVEADKAQALARNVTLTVTSEAENASAGFTSVRIVLPEGIAPADVSLAEGPKGWKLKPAADGYSVSGPKLANGTDAVHKIRIKQLPDAEELAFKAVETYSDGKVSRWIELPTGGEEPEQPAPVLELKAAAPGAKPLSPSSRSSPTTNPNQSATASASPSTEKPSASESTASQEPSAEAAEKNDDDSSSSGLLIGVIVVALLAAGGGTWWLLRRRATA